MDWISINIIARSFIALIIKSFWVIIFITAIGLIAVTGSGHDQKRCISDNRL